MESNWLINTLIDQMLSALSHLQGMTQSIVRLPGGGPQNSCRCNERDVDNYHIKLPVHNRMKRPVCIVFDELDPIAALEESYEVTATAESKETIFVQHTATQTDDSISFLNSSLVVDRESSESIIEELRRQSVYPNKERGYEDLIEYKEKQHFPTQIANDELAQDVQNNKRAPVTELYSTSDSSKQPIENPENTFEDTKRIVEKPDTSLRMANSNQPNFLQLKSAWRRSLASQFPKIAVRSDKRRHASRRKGPEKVDKETQSELVQEDKVCNKCEFIPSIGRQLSRMHFKIERLEANVTKLEMAIALNSQSKQQEIKGNVPQQAQIETKQNDSSRFVVICDASTSIPSNRNNTGWNTFIIPKESIARRQIDKETSNVSKSKRKSYVINKLELDEESPLIIRRPTNTNASNEPCSCSQNKPSVAQYNPNILTEPMLAHGITQTINGRPFIIDAPQKNNTSSEPFKSCSCSQNESRVQPQSDPVLERQASSVCQFCSDKDLPVLHHLGCEVVKLIEKRPFKDIMLSILLRADNIYHVNVQLRETKRVLGCLLVNHAAIEEAIDQDFFKDILTYSVIDVRSTIKPVGRPFGIPFEFVPKPRENVQNNAVARADDTKSLQFITKVLGVREDKLRN